MRAGGEILPLLLFYHFGPSWPEVIGIILLHSQFVEKHLIAFLGVIENFIKR